MIERLVFDIETVPDQRPGVLEAIRETISPPANYKKPETIEKWMAENADDQADHEYRKLALNGLTCEICSIAWETEDDDNRGAVTRVAGDKMDERELLLKFARSMFALYKRDRHVTRPLFVGHNVLGFDLRILMQRCLVNRVALPWRLPVDARHGRDVFDTMHAWSGWRDYVKLDDLYRALCPDMPIDEGMDGSKVLDLFRDGQRTQLQRYNEFDVVKAHAVYQYFTDLHDPAV